MNRVCPSCQKPLLSGFSPRCSFCGATVPSELLFSARTKAKIEAEEADAKRALAETEKENERKRRERRQRMARLASRQWF